ncbi:MAG: DUF1049 domain-containing protein [Rhizobiales bacterium]|nr:DUF1049 domain-containing protein [Hyphomicrobiales bacterium]
MVRKIVTIFILSPLAIVIVTFAVANRQTVTVSFDPFSSTQPALSVSVPLFLLIFALTILGVMVGGFAAWLRQAKWRRAARRREADNRALRREIELLNARLDAAPLSPAPLDAARIPYRSEAL